MIHIVFQHNDIAALQKAFELEPSFHGEVVYIEDELACGAYSGYFTWSWGHRDPGKQCGGGEASGSAEAIMRAGWEPGGPATTMRRSGR